MWSNKGQKDESGGPHSEERMKMAIEGSPKTAEGLAEAKKALIKLKNLMGARQYMRHPTIANIFKKQKERIGDMLDKIDNVLPNHPRNDIKDSKTFAPWEPQNLKTLWNEYMDYRFGIAKKRVEIDMDGYLKSLKTHWSMRKSGPKTNPNSKPAPKPAAGPSAPKPDLNSRPASPKPGSSDDELAAQLDRLNLDEAGERALKEFSDLIEKVEAAWRKEKNVQWDAPW